MRAAVLALVLVALAGCAGVRPPPPVEAAVIPPAAWRNSPGGDQPIDAEWWRRFGDPVLPQLVQAALAHNSDVAVAAARVDEARAQARLARAGLAPQLDLAGGASRTRELSALGAATTTTGGEPELTVSYDLDLFGRLRSASAAARASLLASQGARDSVRLAVVAATATGYLTLRALDAQLDTAQATMTGRAAALRIARRQAETGYTSQLEYRQAQAEYRAAEQLIPQTELAISRQEDSLSLLTGTAPRAIPRGVAFQQLVAPPLPEGLPADVLRRRPDLFEAEQNLVAADRSLDSARAAFLPDVQLTGSVGLILSNALANPVRVWSAGGSILAPLFDGGRIAAQADVAAARRNQAAFAYRSAALTAFREVEDALAAVSRLEEQEVALRAQREALAESLRLATNRYRAGYSPYLEQVLAQRSLLAADLSLIQARSDRLSAYVGLYRALGGGWSRGEVAR
jgi:multidrug efflux system outer membrane protein